MTRENAESKGSMSVSHEGERNSSRVGEQPAATARGKPLAVTRQARRAQTTSMTAAQPLIRRIMRSGADHLPLRTVIQRRWTVHPLARPWPRLLYLQRRRQEPNPTAGALPASVPDVVLTERAPQVTTTVAGVAANRSLQRGVSAAPQRRDRRSSADLLISSSQAVNRPPAATAETTAQSQGVALRLAHASSSRDGADQSRSQPTLAIGLPRLSTQIAGRISSMAVMRRAASTAGATGLRPSTLRKSGSMPAMPLMDHRTVAADAMYATAKAGAPPALATTPPSAPLHHTHTRARSVQAQHQSLATPSISGRRTEQPVTVRRSFARHAHLGQGAIGTQRRPLLPALQSGVASATLATAPALAQAHRTMAIAEVPLFVRRNVAMPVGRHSAGRPATTIARSQAGTFVSSVPGQGATHRLALIVAQRKESSGGPPARVQTATGNASLTIAQRSVTQTTVRPDRQDKVPAAQATAPDDTLSGVTTSPNRMPTPVVSPRHSVGLFTHAAVAAGGETVVRAVAAPSLSRFGERQQTALSLSATRMIGGRSATVSTGSGQAAIAVERPSALIHRRITRVATLGDKREQTASAVPGNAVGSFNAPVVAAPWRGTGTPPGQSTTASRQASLPGTQSVASSIAAAQSRQLQLRSAPRFDAPRLPTRLPIPEVSSQTVARGHKANQPIAVQTRTTPALNIAPVRRAAARAPGSPESSAASTTPSAAHRAGPLAGSTVAVANQPVVQIRTARIAPVAAHTDATPLVTQRAVQPSIQPSWVEPPTAASIGIGHPTDIARPVTHPELQAHSDERRQRHLSGQMRPLVQVAQRVQLPLAARQTVPPIIAASLAVSGRRLGTTVQQRTAQTTNSPRETGQQGMTVRNQTATVDGDTFVQSALAAVSMMHPVSPATAALPGSPLPFVQGSTILQRQSALEQAGETQALSPQSDAIDQRHTLPPSNRELPVRVMGQRNQSTQQAASPTALVTRVNRLAMNRQSLGSRYPLTTQPIADRPSIGHWVAQGNRAAGRVLRTRQAPSDPAAQQTLRSTPLVSAHLGREPVAPLMEKHPSMGVTTVDLPAIAATALVHAPQSLQRFSHGHQAVPSVSTTPVSDRPGWRPAAQTTPRSPSLWVARAVNRALTEQGSNVLPTLQPTRERAGLTMDVALPLVQHMTSKADGDLSATARQVAPTQMITRDIGTTTRLMQASAVNGTAAAVTSNGHVRRAPAPEISMPEPFNPTTDGAYGNLPGQAALEQIANEVYLIIERRLILERESMGL